MASINELFENLSSGLASLANAIRAKTGKTDTLGIEDMVAEQDAVFEAGKKAEYDAFWDVFQGNGGRKSYNFAFSYNSVSSGGWSDDLYEPKYPIIVSGQNNLTNTFAYAEGLTDTKVEISVGKAGSGQAGNMNSTFNRARGIVTIRKLKVDETVLFTNTFSECTNLENLTMAGTIGQNGFDVSSCAKLTHDSLMSIINCLEAKASGTWTVTIGTTNLAKLTDAEKAIATQKGWTLA